MQRAGKVSRLLTVGELGRIFRLSPQAIYLRIHRHAPFPPVIKVGKFLRWRPEAVAAWLEKKERKNGR